MKKLLFSKYLFSILLVAGMLLSLAATVNYFVDPFWVFRSIEVEGFNKRKPDAIRRQRMAKSFSIENIKPQGLILGTSRAHFGLRPEHEAWGVSPVYNSALDGSNVYQALRYFQHTVAVSNPRRVVFAVDFRMFNAHVPDTHGDFNEDRLRVDVNGNLSSGFSKDYLISLLSLDAVNASYRTVMRKGRYILRGSGQQMIERAETIEHHKEFLKKEKGHMSNAGWFPMPCRVFEFENPQTGSSSIEYYRKILSIAYQNNIELYIVIPPSHARLWVALNEVGLWPKFEKWKNILVDINENEAEKMNSKPFPIWDFSGFNRYTTEEVPIKDKTKRMKWYLEASHFRPELGDLLLNQVFSSQLEPKNYDFGVIINKRNIQAHLEEIRLGLEQYKKEYPSYYAEIKRMFDETRYWRDAACR